MNIVLRLFLLSFAICLTTISNGQSKDSLTISRRAAQNLYAKALQADLYDSLRQIANERIEYLKLQVDLHRGKDSVTVLSFRAELKQWEEKEVIYKQAIESLQKEIRKLRRKIFWMKIGGVAIAIAGTAIYLSTLK